MYASTDVMYTKMKSSEYTGRTKSRGCAEKVSVSGEGKCVCVSVCAFVCGLSDIILPPFALTSTKPV